MTEAHAQAPQQPESDPAAPYVNSRIPNVADWQFRRYLTMQLLPLFYVLLLLASAVAIGGIVALCFWAHLWAGIVAASLAPLVFLVSAAVIRAVLEYLIMAYRIMRIIERMDALPDQVTDLSHRVDRITGHVDKLILHVDDIHDTVTHARPLLRSASLPGRLLSQLFTPPGGR